MVLLQNFSRPKTTNYTISKNKGMHFKKTDISLIQNTQTPNKKIHTNNRMLMIFRTKNLIIIKNKCLIKNYYTVTTKRKSPIFLIPKATPNKFFLRYLPAKFWMMGTHWPTTTSRRVPPFIWCFDSAEEEGKEEKREEWVIGNGHGPK